MSAKEVRALFEKADRPVVIYMSRRESILRTEFTAEELAGADVVLCAVCGQVCLRRPGAVARAAAEMAEMGCKLLHVCSTCCGYDVMLSRDRFRRGEDRNP